MAFPVSLFAIRFFQDQKKVLHNDLSVKISAQPIYNINIDRSSCLLWIILFFRIFFFCGVVSPKIASKTYLLKLKNIIFKKNNSFWTCWCANKVISSFLPSGFCNKNSFFLFPFFYSFYVEVRQILFLALPWHGVSVLLRFLLVVVIGTLLISHALAVGFFF